MRVCWTFEILVEKTPKHRVFQGITIEFSPHASACCGTVVASGLEPHAVQAAPLEMKPGLHVQDEAPEVKENELDTHEEHGSAPREALKKPGWHGAQGLDTVPAPVEPALQRQVKEPTVLLQTACA